MKGASHVALVGLSGTGKSTVAPLVAERTGRDVVDLDRVIEQRSGRSVTEVFATDGEEHFRRLESEALEAALSGPPAVVATGGGIVTVSAALDLLAARSEVVWLRVDPAELAVRLRSGTEDRPLLGDDAETALRLLSEQREPLYRQVADRILEVGSVPTEDVVERIVANIGVIAQ